MAAALASEGWQDRAADEVLANAMDGYEAVELTRAKRAAASMTAPWSAWADASPESANAAKTLRRLLRQNSPSEPSLPTDGTRFDFDTPAPPVPWLVPNLLVRGSTHMLHGAVHTFKTGFWDAAMLASLTGRPFLGQAVAPLRWLRVDAENPARLIQSRWAALGFQNAHWESIRLHDRSVQVRLAENQWQEWMREQIEDFHPDVLVLDTVARIWFGIDSNDPAEVVAIYEYLQALCDEYGVAVALNAHDRKSGGRGDEAAFGSVQWAGQADQTLTIANTRKIMISPRADGMTDTLSRFSVRLPKGRDVVDSAPLHGEVRGVLDASGTLVSMSVASPKDEVTLTEKIIAALDSPLGTGELAKVLDLNRTGDKFRSALAEATEAGQIVRNADGLYARGAE